jgi:hypothetical protein
LLEQACRSGIPILAISGDIDPMRTKKAKRGKSAAASKAGYFLYHGIKIAKAGKPPSKTAEMIREELLKR